MTHLNIGDKAPDFKAKIQDGTEKSLSDYAGKKLILFFYPKDNTPGCTKEACDFRDNNATLKADGYELLGVSCNDEKSHNKFIDKFDLPFDLIADTDQTVVNAFGVWGEKKFMGKLYDGIHRTTFVINEEGVIDLIIKKVKTAAPTEQLLTELKNV